MSNRNTKQLRRAFGLRPFCGYCDEPLSYDQYSVRYATLDHIIPKSRGGTESLDNKTLACLGCNASKSNSKSWPAPSFTFADLWEPSQLHDFDDIDWDDGFDD